MWYYKKSLNSMRRRSTELRVCDKRSARRDLIVRKKRT
jgi:hypothetical protein